VAQKAARDKEKKKALLKQAERLIKEEQKSEPKAYAKA